MKRLISWLVTIGAVTALWAGAAAAQPVPWTLTLSTTPSTVLVDNPFTAQGKLTDGTGAGIPVQEIMLSIWNNGACSGATIGTAPNFTGLNGEYSYDLRFAVAGIYSLQTEATGVAPGEHAVSPCVTVNVVTSLAPAVVGIRGPDSTFLCYSRYPDSTPGVFTFETAGNLLKGSPWSGPDRLTGGYSVPIAVQGNVPFGTNFGGYHLVCNPGSLAPLGNYTDASGDSISAADAASIRATWQSDLNLYPVYG
jgi:hypothetical protein